MTECVFDTNVLQKANAPLHNQPKENRKFAKRIALLRRIQSGHLEILISHKLLIEYNNHILEPRNDLIKFFLEQLTSPRGAIFNWYTPWNARRDDAVDCGFPAHDHHVLRTAIRPGRSRIYTEENGILGSAKCIKRRFNVEILDVE